MSGRRFAATFGIDLEFQGVFYAQNLCISTLNPLRLGVLA
jgi:hypothetical protein